MEGEKKAKERQKYKGKWLIFTVRFQKKQKKPRQNEINLTLESWEVGKESFFRGGGLNRINLCSAATAMSGEIRQFTKFKPIL